MSYTIKAARYSKGNLAVHCVSDGQWFKTRAMRLIANHLNGRWSNREKAYIVSPSKADKFEKLFNEGFDADTMTGEIFNPAIE